MISAAAIGDIASRGSGSAGQCDIVLLTNRTCVLCYLVHTFYCRSQRDDEDLYRRSASVPDSAAGALPRLQRADRSRRGVCNLPCLRLLALRGVGLARGAVTHTGVAGTSRLRFSAYTGQVLNLTVTTGISLQTLSTILTMVDQFAAVPVSDLVDVGSDALENERIVGGAEYRAVILLEDLD